MKYLFLIGLVLVILWLWQAKRRSNLASKSGPPPPQGQHRAPAQPTEMVACDVCSLHLPRTEALTSGQGIYCSDEHRRQAEG